MPEAETQLVKYQPTAPVGTARHFGALLRQLQGEFAKVVAEGVSMERILQTAMIAVQKNPKLIECSQGSVVGALLEASQLGLEVGGATHEASLVPFKTKTGMHAQLIPEYRGKIKLMRNAGASRVAAAIVYHKDKFDIDRVAGTITHEFDARKSASERGGPMGAWALVKSGEETNVDYMGADEIAAIRARSKAKDSGPWVTDELEMWKKTVIHRVSKLCPMSVTPPRERRRLTPEEALGLSDALDEQTFELAELPEAEAEAPAIQQGSGETKTEAVTREAKRQKADRTKQEAAAQVTEDLAEPEPGSLEDLDRELAEHDAEVPKGRLLSDAQIEAIYTEIKSAHPPEMSDDEAVTDFDQKFVEAFKALDYRQLEDLQPADALSFSLLLNSFGIKAPR